MYFLNLWAFLFFIPSIYIFLKVQKLSKDKNSKHKQLNLFLLSLFFIIIALSRPAIIDKTKKNFQANEYILALDISYSMQVKDVKNTRYEVAKNIIIDILKQSHKDRFTLFAFTSNPLLISPPSIDTQIIFNALNVLDPKNILTKGTSLKALLETISQIKKKYKNLIILSDGGDEHNLNSLINIARKNNIRINIIAIASKKGSILRYNNQAIKDENQHLVISKINPILKKLALETSGLYYEANQYNTNIAIDFYTKLDQKSTIKKKLELEILAYKEYYYYPLLLAFFILFISVTKIQKYIFLFLFLFIPLQKVEASIFDFYYIQKANNMYKEKNYKKAIFYFKKIKPSKELYFNLSNAYYCNKQYKLAMEYYSLIRTKKKTLKQNIYYNMGNCATKLKRYTIAKQYYQKALAFGFDQKSYNNLMFVYAIEIKNKKDITTQLPKTNIQKVKNRSYINKKEKDEKETGGKSNQNSSLKSNGSGDNLEKKDNKKKESKKQLNKIDQYQMPYRAYELINKGYTNEKHPW